MRPKAKPSRPPSRLVPALLAMMTAAVGFATLMVRLEVTREGYRISAVREEIARYQDENRHLRLASAQLSSHERLRALAPRFHLAPPARGQVVLVP
jgi:cell division protein FtsL